VGLAPVGGNEAKGGESRACVTLVERLDAVVQHHIAHAVYGLSTALQQGIRDGVGKLVRLTEMIPMAMPAGTITACPLRGNGICQVAGYLAPFPP
jgi:hypothetical protein